MAKEKKEPSLPSTDTRIVPKSLVQEITRVVATLLGPPVVELTLGLGVSCQLGNYLRIGPGPRRLNGSSSSLVQRLLKPPRAESVSEAARIQLVRTFAASLLSTD